MQQLYFMSISFNSERFACFVKYNVIKDEGPKTKLVESQFTFSIFRPISAGAQLICSKNLCLVY